MVLPLKVIWGALSDIHPGLHDNEARTLYDKYEETLNRSLLVDILKRLLETSLTLDLTLRCSQVDP